ncbi:ATP-dependent protease ATPase subunit HslU [Tepiditoga spiralis]|uniref:ATP-dependent protease ATPase subunit HslU n=1 Tax=Tepiditoga spiralis TaxID=2108365 RepID=A0A7G1G4E7_9BACT|nr:ATP-dependent protease ATPase subunit HslU [Tepiditoga spiralis]BBE31370.1 ATP-dependent protease ATPase subunit HslU [Tepiditoga spiralis]
MVLDKLTPKEIVAQLNKYIIGQNIAKKQVSIALRNRIRRLKLEENMRKEVIPKNILMIGPTGVGKTEIARRLAQIAKAPFIKVEATRFTEVGYVGKNVESMIKELMDVSVNLVRTEMMEKVEELAKKMVEQRIVEALVPASKKQNSNANFMEMFQMFNQQGNYQNQKKETIEEPEIKRRREEIYEQLKKGELENIEIEIELEEDSTPMFAGMGSEFEDMGMQIGEMFSNLMPKKKKKRKMKVSEARKILQPIEAEKLIDKEKMIQEGIERAQSRGIIFIDEIDKITAKGSGAGPDVSREGVQRDLLPIVEGTNVMTKYGQVKTDYILFIAAGAFHMAKPSDLIPELQGRFPVRVELQDLTEDDFIKILVEPENAIIKQYKALLLTDDVELEFSEDGIKEIAKISFELNEKVENIGARRLYTVVEKVLEEVSYEAPSSTAWKVVVNSEYVKAKLGDIVKDENLREYVL